MYQIAPLVPWLVMEFATSSSGTELRVMDLMPWSPPSFAYLLNCQSLACLSICASALKSQQSAKTYVVVSKHTYLFIDRSDTEARLCNRRHYSNLLESLGGQCHKGGLEIARSKDDKKSSLAYLWINAILVLTYQSPPATLTLLDKTYKRAASGTALASLVRIFLYRCRSRSSNYFRKNH